MAGLFARQSPCQNPLSAGKNELAGAILRALTDDSGILSHTFAMSRIIPLALAPPFAPAKLVAKYINTDLQQASKLALK